jgi:transketolase
MRKAFAEAVADLADADPRVVFLTADLGFMALDAYMERHPDRFINVGVAEQNMLGLATGLAQAGWKPYVYSIATFATLRAYEFIRDGPVRHQLPVRIAGVGGGFEYGSAGFSHHAIEDLGVMRLQPGLTVVAPADHRQARSAVLSTAALPGPVYIRLGKDDKTVVPGLEGSFELGRADRVREGRDVLLISIGAITTETVAAAELLARDGTEAAVLVVSSLNPAPTADLARSLADHRLAVTVEAHQVSGGLGSLVAEEIAERGLGCRLVRCGVRSSGTGSSGGQAHLEAFHGISAAAIARTVRSSLATAAVP